MSLLKKSLILFTILHSIFIFSVSAQALQEKSIDKIMELKKEHQRLNPKIDGYKVQLYNGDESNAYSVRTKFLTLFPDMKVEITYKAPEWKVQVGNFRTRLEADKSLLKIKEQFPGSLTVRAKINP